MSAIEADGWRLETRADLGGAIGRLAWHGEDVLRPTLASAVSPLETACFPLVPYANRVAEGRFAFNGREVRLPVLAQFHPHALHGDGWLEPWDVVAEGEKSVVMEFVHGGGGWPWPYRASQAITVRDGQLCIALSVRNEADEPMPAGLGLHPYFVASGAARLRFTATGVWTTDPTGIPDQLSYMSEMLDWSRGRRLDQAPDIDHCYEGWSGVASIHEHARTILVRASSNASRAQVYAPQQAGFVCFEPVTHRPDALNARSGECTGLAILDPGETLAMEMAISID